MGLRLQATQENTRSPLGHPKEGTPHGSLLSAYPPPTLPQVFCPSGQPQVSLLFLTGGGSERPGLGTTGVPCTSEEPDRPSLLLCLSLPICSTKQLSQAILPSSWAPCHYSVCISPAQSQRSEAGPPTPSSSRVPHHPPLPAEQGTVGSSKWRDAGLSFHKHPHWPLG